MKGFLSRINIDNIKKNLLLTYNRFPFSVIVLFIGAAIFFSFIHLDIPGDIQEYLVKTILSLVILFFLSAGITLYNESTGQGKKQRIVSQIGVLIFSIVFYFGFSNFTDDFENIIYFFLTITGIVSLLFFSPYIKNILKKDISQQSYYSYFYSISVVFLLGSILGGVLSALGGIAIGSVFTLFDLDTFIRADKVFMDWMVVSGIIIAPIYALGQIPLKETFKEKYFNENAFFSFLIKYIATPFIYIYFFILYAYIVKVLMNFSEWPRGEVSWMVIGFSTFGYIIYMFSYIFGEKNNFIGTFRKLFPYAVIPQIFMLFYAIYLRINQYDLTVNRYFVVVFGVWLLALSLYYVISRKKYLLAVPASLTLVSILISVGPWSVYQLPESRQLSRLTQNMTEAEILKNGEIIPLLSEESISQELSKEIYQGIDYLCDFDSCKNIKELFPTIYANIVQEDKKVFEKQKQQDLENYSNDTEMIQKVTERQYNEPNSWEIVEKITKKLKVKNYFYNNTQQEYKYLSLDYNKSFFPIDVTGYTKMYEFSGYKEVEKKNILYFNRKEKTIETPEGQIFNLESILTELENLIDTPNDRVVNPEQLTFELSGARVFIQSISLANPKYTGGKTHIRYDDLHGYILTK